MPRAREEWRPTTDLTRQTPGKAAGLRYRKVWRTGVLQSSVAGTEHCKMALWTLENAPFSVILHHVFDGFLGVFPPAFPSSRKEARIRTRKGQVRVQTGAIER
jgi:hypothetical protein